jgi:hypothetical protein
MTSPVKPAPSARMGDPSGLEESVEGAERNTEGGDRN